MRFEAVRMMLSQHSDSRSNPTMCKPYRNKGSKRFQKQRVLGSLVAINWVPLLCFLTLFPSVSLGQPDDLALRDQFLQGIALADKKVQAVSVRATCKLSNRTTLDTGEVPLKPAEEFQCAVSGENVMMTGLNKRSGNVYFRVRNPAYAFALERSNEGVRTSLQFVEQRGVNPAIDAQVSQYEAIVRGSTLSPYYLFAHPLFQTFNEGTFQIKDVSRVQTEGSELVRVEFDGVVSESAADGSGPTPAYTYSDAFLICDPGKNWAMTEYAGNLYVHINNGHARHHVKLQAWKTVLPGV
jgi:hypothetical protein